MSTSLLPPTVQALINGLVRRVEILERRIRIDAINAETTHEILFSYAGTLAATDSPPVRVRRGGHLAVLAITLGTAGSTDTVLTVQKNGVAVATVTVPASSTTYSALVGARFVADVDVLILTITTAGTGAADMTAEARFT